MLKLAHFITHPIQYAAPLYRRIAADGEVDLTVLFGSRFGLDASYDAGFCQEIQFDVPLLDGYSSGFVHNHGNGIPDGQFGSFDCPAIGRQLVEGQFDAVWVHGWGYRAQWQIFRAAKRLGLPYLVRAETHIETRSANMLRAAARTMFVGRALRQAAACLYVGQANRQFYRSMRVEESRLFPAHYAVDAQRFQQATRTIDERNAIRQRFGTRANDFVVVTAAKMIPRKRIDDIIRAIGELPEAVLWIVGDGSERASLETLARRIAPERIRFLDFVNQMEMPNVLSAADAFVLASDDEPWGLAVNEAMACGLPVVVADRVGCVPDLVRERLTGFAFPAGNVTILAERLGWLGMYRERAAEMGEAGRELVLREYDVSTTAKQIVQAVNTVCTAKAATA